MTLQTTVFHSENHGMVIDYRHTNNDAAQRLAIAGTASPHRNLVERPAMDVVIVAPRTYHPQIGPAECKPWRLAASKPSRSLRAWIYRRDGGACVECGATEPLTLDHIWPAVRGGTEWASNLRTLCRSCNSRRGDALRAELGTVFYPSRPRYLEPRECA